MDNGTADTTRQDRILVVDDDEFVCNSLKWLLVDEGYEVEVAPDGRTALGKLTSSDYDLILTDLMMPEVDGLAVLREARKNDPDAAVIILTGYGTLEAAMTALQDGAYDFLTKPCDDGEMKYKIRGALEQRRLRRRVAHLEETCGKTPAGRELLRDALAAVSAQLARIESQPPAQASRSLSTLRERLGRIVSLCAGGARTLDAAEVRRRLDGLSE